MLLSQKEKKFVDTYMTLPVKCPARHYSEMIYRGTITPEYLLDAEIFLSLINEQCSERWLFRRLFEDHQIRAGAEQKRREDPTTQELDRSAWKKTSVRITAWFHFAGRKLGFIKKIATLR